MLFKEVYRVVENPYEKDAGIELISGEWEGLVYQYGDVQFVNGEPQLNFKRTIRRVPNGVEANEEVIEELLNNNELNKLMGDILVELMQEQMKREKNEQRDSKTGN
tara:strand:- start:205 stop:522 length:318 start_codon:yes stop_codon:yes gene_type:complete